VTDPNGMIVEFTCDDPRAALGEADRRANAHAELKRWLAGDRSTNNDFRHAEAA
jgi:glyoxylase I family protein